MTVYLSTKIISPIFRGWMELGVGAAHPASNRPEVHPQKIQSQDVILRSSLSMLTNVQRMVQICLSGILVWIQFSINCTWLLTCSLQISRLNRTVTIRRLIRTGQRWPVMGTVAANLCTRPSPSVQMFYCRIIMFANRNPVDNLSDVLFAMHTEMAERTRRRCSIVISDLPSSRSSDLDLTRDFFVSHMGLDAQQRGHGGVGGWEGSNPPTLKKGTHEISANPNTFWGGGWGRVESEKTWAVSDCSK